MLCGQLVGSDDRFDQLTVTGIVWQVIGGAGVEDQPVQRTPGMANLLARMGNVMFFMQLPRQTQQLAAVACPQIIQCIAILATRGNAMSFIEHPLHQSQAKSVACARNPETA